MRGPRSYAPGEVGHNPLHLVVGNSAPVYAQSIIYEFIYKIIYEFYRIIQQIHEYIYIYIYIYIYGQFS